MLLRFRRGLGRNLSWVIPGLVAGLRACFKGKYDIVWATGDPLSSLQIGYWLSRITRKPLILDIRDPLTYGCLWLPHDRWHAAYMQKMKEEKGTFFLAKGFIEVGDTPLEEYERTVRRHGKDVADRVMKIMFAHYKRILFVNTGHNEIGKHRDHAQRAAKQFNLRYEERKGSRDLIIKMIHGPWDEEFIIAKPGETITLEQFLKK